MQVILFGFYLFLLFFVALVGRELVPWLNTLVLWGFGPLVTAIIIATRWKRLKLMPKEYFFFLMLVPIALIGYLQIEFFPGYWRYFRSLLTNAVLFILPFLVIRKPQDWYQIMKVILISVFLSVVIAHVYAPKDLEYELTRRLSGLQANANGVASYARVSILISMLFIMLAKKRVIKISLWTIVGFSMYTVLLTASRGGFVNASLVVIAFVPINYGLKRVFVFLIPLVFFLAMALWSSISNSLEQLYLFERITRNETVDAVLENESRVDLYRSTWDQFLDYPIFGSGLYQYITKGTGMMSHSDFLDIAVQLGILGLGFYLAIYLSLYSKLIQSISSSSKEVKKLLLWSMVILTSEVLYGFTNPNWFSQLQIILLSMIVVITHQLRKRKLQW